MRFNFDGHYAYGGSEVLTTLFRLDNYAVFDWGRTSHSLKDNISLLCELCATNCTDYNTADALNKILSTVYFDYNGNMYVYPKPVMSNPDKTWDSYKQRTQDKYACGSYSTHDNYIEDTVTPNNELLIGCHVISNPAIYTHDISAYMFNNKPIPAVIQDIIKYMTCGCIIHTLKNNPNDIEQMFFIPRNHECGVILYYILPYIADSLYAGYRCFHNQGSDISQNNIRNEYHNEPRAFELIAKNQGPGAKLRYGFAGPIIHTKRSPEDHGYNEEDIWEDK